MERFFHGPPFAGRAAAVQRNIPVGAIDAIDAETRLMAEGYLDNFSLAALIVELERRLALTLDSGDLLPEDFESPAVLVARLGEIAG